MTWPARFCADCGAPLAAPAADDRSACARCGATHYRNAKPCAGVLIERRGKVLLARRGIDPCRGMWDVVGGFVRPHEHPAETALREAAEETGLDVVLGALLGMFVDRYGNGPGDDYTLNIYFAARAPRGRPRAASDVAELRWFARDGLPHDMAFPHERELLSAWRDSHLSAARRRPIGGRA